MKRPSVFSFPIFLFLVALSFFGFQAVLTVQNSDAAEKLGKLETSNMSVLLVDAGRAVSIALSPKDHFRRKGKRLVPTVFTVDEPSRVVVDIPMSNKPQRTRKMALNHPYFSGMRLGTHPNKTRVVLEMKKEFAPAFRITPVKKLGAVLINFKMPGQAASVPQDGIEAPEQVSVENPPTVEALEQVPLLPAPSPVVKTAKMHYAGARFQRGVFVTDRGVITHRGVPGPKIKKSKNAGPARVSYVRFVRSKVSGLDSLAIKVGRVYGISLRPVGDSSYQLTLKKTELGKHEPLSPGLGFQKVTPKQNGENLLFDIEVKQGVQLAADMNNGLLLLRATAQS